jgi:hypothetical protein
VIRHTLTGEFHSRFSRSHDQQALLVAQGGELYILELHGHLFEHNSIYDCQKRLNDAGCRP